MWYLILSIPDPCCLSYLHNNTALTRENLFGCLRPGKFKTQVCQEYYLVTVPFRISNYIVSTKIYDKRDNFDFETAQ